MPTLPVSLDDIAKRVRQVLELSPRVTTLSASLSASATSATVASATGISADSKIEIAQELILVGGVAGTTLSTLSRGYMGTTALTYASGQPVTVDPRYPTVNIYEAVNVALDWISAFAPRLVWDTTTAGSFRSNRLVYPVAADATDVRRVAYRVPGYDALRDVSFGQLQPFPTAIASTGQGVEVHEIGLSGRTVQMLVEKPWDRLTSASSQVPSDFPALGDTLLVDGAVLYLVGYRLIPKFRLDETVFHREANAPVPPNTNVRNVELMQQDWIANLRRIAGERAVGAHPQKIWVGAPRRRLF